MPAEPTASGKPAPIPVTVVDAEQTLALPDEEARLARAQVAGGDLVVLNKVDLVDEATLGRVRDWLRDIRTIVSDTPMQLGMTCSPRLTSLLTTCLVSLPSSPTGRLGGPCNVLTGVGAEHGLA